MKPPAIVNGYVTTPRQLSEYEYFGHQERRYADGLKMIIGINHNGSEMGIVWDTAKGTAQGFLMRRIYGPSDIGNLVKSYRRGSRGKQFRPSR